MRKTMVLAGLVAALAAGSAAGSSPGPLLETKTKQTLPFLLNVAEAGDGYTVTLTLPAGKTALENVYRVQLRLEEGKGRHVYAMLEIQTDTRTSDRTVTVYVGKELLPNAKLQLLSSPPAQRGVKDAAYLVDLQTYAEGAK